MFDFYDGGGLDVASLSFAEVDVEGNVNVHRFPGRLRGPGGFPNISARTGRLCFVGTLTTGGLAVTIDQGRLRIDQEGKVGKFVGKVAEVSFSGAIARQRGQNVRYITERAVFALGPEGLTLIEVAEGFDPETDVIAHMGFRPAIADPLGVMDPAVFQPGPLGLAARYGR
jgi:acyl CoA:acetate/3-ketoacid CoA transferase